MALFVFQHFLHDQPGLAVLFGQGFQVVPQVVADPLFRGCHKAQADLVADRAGHRPQGEGQAVPGGVEDTGPAVQLAQALLAPHQVIDLLRRRLLHLFPHGGQFRGEGLPLVERLGADLAGMVDPHQPGGMSPFAIR